MNTGDVITWAAIVVTVSSAVLAMRLVILQRRHAALGWRLARSESQHRETIAAHSQAELRTELAHRLHDDLGHRLTLVAVTAGVLESKADESLRADVAALREQVANAVEELNHSVSALDSSTETLTPLLRVVDEAVLPAQSAGAGINIVVPADAPPLSARLASVTMAIIREGVTNALKHSPGGTIELNVDLEGDELRLCLISGPATRPSRASTGGRGLEALRARVEDHGGSFAAGPGHRHGAWTVEAALPIVDSPDLSVVHQDAALARTVRRTRGQLIAIPAVALLLFAAVPAAWVVARGALSQLDRADFDQITVGMVQSEAETHLPALDMDAPPRARGVGDCRHHEATMSPFDRDTVFEVCFVDGRVASTTVIPTP